MCLEGIINNQLIREHVLNFKTNNWFALIVNISGDIALLLASPSALLIQEQQTVSNSGGTFDIDWE